jgi:hypothetical protein
MQVQATRCRGSTATGALALSPALALAETAQGTDIDWLKLFLGLFGGLALFLFGMEQLADGPQGGGRRQPQEAHGAADRKPFHGCRDRPEPARIIVRPKFLDKELLAAPALAPAREREVRIRLGSPGLRRRRARATTMSVPHRRRYTRDMAHSIQDRRKPICGDAGRSARNHANDAP